ncbi:MAG TPA: long-chain fatty acid--CoA ligase, partial [Thermomicrobiales bacterium]
ELRLLDTNGEPVEEGAIGEIVIRSPGMMRGYLGEPETTAAVLRDGWFHTGDLARRDAEGRFFLVGRQSLQINVGGFKVAPEEVEQTLRAHPGVREVVILPMPHRILGEAVRAVIVPHDPPPDAQALRRFCQRALAGYKVPRRIDFRDELPRSTLGKVLRHQL